MIAHYYAIGIEFFFATAFGAKISFASHLRLALHFVICPDACSKGSVCSATNMQFETVQRVFDYLPNTQHTSYSQLRNSYAIDRRVRVRDLAPETKEIVSSEKQMLSIRRGSGAKTNGMWPLIT